MWLEAIGRTIGDIFGFNRKKREDQPRPQPRPTQPRPQPGFNQGTFNSGVSQFRAPAAQPAKPSTVGQPIQSGADYFAKTGRMAPSGSMLAARPEDRVSPQRPNEQQVKQVLKDRARKEAERRAGGRVIRDVGNFVAGSNENFLGGTGRQAVKIANLVGSGFDDGEAERRTNEFLRATGQMDKSGNAPLSRGADRDSTAFKVGQGVGTAQGIATDIATTAIPGAGAEKALRGIGLLNKGLQSTNKAVKFGSKTVPVIGGGLVSSAVSQAKDPLQNAGQNFASNAAIDAAGILLPGALKGVKNAVQSRPKVSIKPPASSRVSQTAKGVQANPERKVVGLDGKPIDMVGDDVILYHNTNKAGVTGIKNDGYLDPRRAGTGNDKALTEDGYVSYVSTSPQDVYGTEAIKVKMPIANFRKAMQENAKTIAKLEQEIANGEIPEMYVEGVRRQIENIKRNPEILSQNRLNILAEEEPPTLGFGDYTDQLLRNTGIDTEKGLVKGNVLYNNPLTKTYNKGQQAIIETIDKGRDKLSGQIRKGLESENKLTSSVSRLPQVAFKNFGQSDANRQILTARSSKIQSAGEVARLVQKDLEKAVKATGNPEVTNRRIYQVLETPEYLEKVYKDPTKLTINDLAPQEKVVMEKLIASNKIRNDLNLQTGVITPEVHAQYADGMHSPRIYDLEAEGMAQKAGRMMDSKAGIKRKDITKIDDAITDNALKDPTLASSVRLETALRNKANLEALDELAGAGLIRDTPPNKNFVKLEGKQFGKWNGQYVDKQIKSQLDGKDYFNSEIGQKVGDLVEAYQGTPVAALGRAQKKIKTVYAPATNIGNIASNILAFSGAANVNSATVAARMAQAGKQLLKHSRKFDANVYRAEKAGLFSGDTGKQLVGKNEDALKTLEKKSKNPLKAIESFYGKTDQAAALGIFNELKARGLTDAQAVRRAHKAVQDYNNVGRGINTLADSPVLGKPFARFTPELLRIMKNNVIYNPVGTAAKIGGLAAGGAALSSAAGETEEERKAREDTVGQTKLPGTGFINNLVTGGKNKDDVSLNLPIGDSAVNIARASGLNFPIEPGGDASSALIRQLSPVADITRKTADGKTEIAPNQLVSDMFFRPITDQLTNRDFMGRQITDPDNKIISEIGRGKSQYENADGSRQSPGVGVEIGNRIRSAAMSYLPLSSEADAIFNAATKQKDYYGKERTPTEAILRGVGLKTESNTKEVREKRVSTKEFFEGKDKQVKDFLVNNPEVADDYFKFNDSSRDRFTNKKSSSLVTPERWSVVKGETTGKLFNQLKQEALDAAEKDGKPVDPIFNLDDKQTKELVAIRSTAPGDSIEREEILRATTDWYKPFEDAERKYYTDTDAYFDKLPEGKKPADKNDRVKEYTAIKYPQNTALQDEYYNLRYGNEGKGVAPNELAGKAFYKAHADQLNADRESKLIAKLEYYNKKRAILGLEPIGRETLETESTKGSYFKKSGRGGKSKAKKPDLGKSEYSYAVALKSGGALPKPQVKKKTTPIKIASARTAKPKVSLKKSSV